MTKMTRTIEFLTPTGSVVTFKNMPVRQIRLCLEAMDLVNFNQPEQIRDYEALLEAILLTEDDVAFLTSIGVAVESFTAETLSTSVFHRL